MALRWYSTVVDCRDVRKQAGWWAGALDWQVIHESDEECVIIPSWVDEKVAQETPWERIGAGLAFVSVPEGKAGKNRLHIDLAPHTSQDRDAEITRLERLGARRVNVGQGNDVSWTYSKTARATCSASSAPAPSDTRIGDRGRCSSPLPMS